MANLLFTLASLITAVSSFTPTTVRTPHQLTRTPSTSTTQLFVEHHHVLNGAVSSPGRKKVLVLGGDGFCGWPTSLHLSDQGHDVVIVDNLSRRNIDTELGCDSLTPIQSPEVRFSRDDLIDEAPESPHNFASRESSVSSTR